MQYVRNLSDSVSTAWNSLNPATLSGAIDVIVVEQDDGSLVCSPFHVRFGKFSLLRPYEKKVEFKVNGVKQDYAMKLGEGGEAFFVFETADNIPQSLQTSPLVSPASSPPLSPETPQSQPGLQEPELLELDGSSGQPRRPGLSVLPPAAMAQDAAGDAIATAKTTTNLAGGRPVSGDWSGAIPRPQSDDMLRKTARSSVVGEIDRDEESSDPALSERSRSPPPLAPKEAIERAVALSRELAAANIPNQVSATGDLMLDMTAFKSNEEDAFRAEIFARRLLSEEMDGNYDIGSLFGMDEKGNLWIYSSIEAKEEAMKRAMDASLRNGPAPMAVDAASDPGYQSDGSDGSTSSRIPQHRRAESDLGNMELGLEASGHARGLGNPYRNYAKTLRLTSEQLRALRLTPGENPMSFTVNRATCQANMYLWTHDTPVVISDIDGTITKSDALGHVLNMIGRDWTHSGVAKLYNDIVTNGYNIMYLTSRSVGQADTTRTYLGGIVQEGCRLPRGPTILSPDRTMAALRREIYLRKPHVFKMATLRDIRSLYGPEHKPFYAGFGNRLTDQISYRTVDVPRNRIFTINSNAEVSLDLLSLNKLKLSYVNINEVVDHYFPPVSTLVKGGGEEYTDFTYWRDTPLELDEFSASDSDEDEDEDEEEPEGQYADDEEEEEEEEEEEVGDGMGDSYISRDSVDDGHQEGSVMSGSVDEEQLMSSIIQEADAADAEGEPEVEIDVEFDPENEEEVTQVLEEATGERPQGSHAVVEDVGAEIITGVKHLSMEHEGSVEEKG